MAILKNQEVYFARLNPARPDARMDPEKPVWSVQVRTTSKEQRQEWKEMGIIPKVKRENPDDDESKVLYYYTSFRKKAIKKDERTEKVTKANPPEVVNGKHVEIDPSSVGNGSICNLKLFKREYEAGGIKKISYVLMGVQVVKHVVYVGVPMEDFDDAETETVMPDAAKPAGDDDDDGVY